MQTILKKLKKGNVELKTIIAIKFEEQTHAHTLILSIHPKQRLKHKPDRRIL